MYSIGDFSKITGITIKALRLYHEKDLLVPALIEDGSGYRYYDANNLEKARSIVYLKQMQIPLEEIRELLDSFEDDSHALDFLEAHRAKLTARVRELQKIKVSIDEIVAREREAMEMLEKNEFEVEEREIDTILVASVRWKGRYQDCGDKFGLLYKKMGRVSCGKPMNLYYDEGYVEDNADIETCLPIRKGKEAEGISVKELEGGRACILMHKGPYDQIGRSYEKISSYINKKGYKVQVPCREVYVKGPGMIFKGNPKNYLTEIQFVVEGAE